MSKPCQGTELAPIKLSTIVTAPSKYVLPSARKETAVLSAKEMSSEVLFPTLGAVEKKAWAPALSFKKNVEVGIERTKTEVEEGVRREQITDPYEMTRDELEKNGWHTMSLKPDLQQFDAKIRIHPEAYTAETDPFLLTPDLVKNESVLRSCTELINADGTPIERDKKVKESQIYYNPESVKRATQKMWAFAGKKVAV